MNTHLTPQLIVEAVEGTLGSAAREHLGACDACRVEVDRVRAILREAEHAAPLREPSPLFWDHFADRIREATSTLPVTSRQSGWHGWWRPALLVGAAAAVIALVVSIPRLMPEAPAVELERVAADGDALRAMDFEGWDLVVSLTDDLAWDEVQQVARPRVGVADAVIDELSPQERAAFVKLLKQEMGGVE